MRFVVFSDLHAHNFNSYEFTTKDGLNSRLEITLKVLEGIQSYALENNIKGIVFAGDLFDKKKKTPAVVIYEVFNRLREWSRVGLTVLVVPGNHDFLVRSGEKHLPDLFSELPGFFVASTPGKYTWGWDEEELEITIVPFADKFEEDEFKKDGQNNRLCISHGIPSNAKIQKGHVREAGEVVYGSEAMIPVKWLKQYDLSIVGHIHYPQFMTLSKKSSLLIPGQPWQQWPHEKDQERGIWDVEVLEKNISVTPVELNVPKFKECFISNDQGLSGDYKDNIQGNIILVMPETNQIDLSFILELKQDLFSQEAYHVAVMPPEKVEIKSIEGEKRDLPSIWDTNKLLSGVLDDEIEDEGERLELFKLGKKVLEKVEK